MPIDITEFEQTEEAERTTAECIVEFLLENKEKAFTRSEIATAIDRDPNTVGSNLSRLKDRGLVRHRKQHWAITDDLDRVIEAMRFSDLLSSLKVEYGSLITDSEDAKAWADAQPERPHPSEDDDEKAGESTRTGTLFDSAESQSD